MSPRVRQWQFWPSDCREHFWVATSNNTLNQARRCVNCGMPHWVDFFPTGVIYHEQRTR